MKKLILTIIALVVATVSYAQDNTQVSQRLKYITTAPDGSIAMTIYDDTKKDNMKLESAISFYRFEILDTKTSESVYASKNQGKECTIDKTKIASGTYNVRLYTSNFIITSEIIISETESSIGVIG